MKIKAKTLAILIVAIMAAGIGLASALGFWNTKGSRQPARFAGGQFAGLPNPSDIRGSYTWNDVSKAFGIDAELLVRAFGASGPDARLNELEARSEAAGLPEGSGIGTDSVRLFVSLMTGMPHVPEANTVLPAAAIPLLRQFAKADPSLVEREAARAFPRQDGGAPADEQAPGEDQAAAQSSAPAAHVQAVGTMTGNTTFRDLGEWGLADAQIRSVIGADPGPEGMTVKQWAAERGMSFGDLKAALQALLDK